MGEVSSDDSEDSLPSPEEEFSSDDNANSRKKPVLRDDNSGDSSESSDDEGSGEESSDGEASDAGQPSSGNAGKSSEHSSVAPSSSSSPLTSKAGPKNSSTPSQISATRAPGSKNSIQTGLSSVDFPTPAEALSGKLDSQGRKQKDVGENIEVVDEDVIQMDEAWGMCLAGYIAGRFPGENAITELCESWDVWYNYCTFKRSGWIIFEFQNDADRKKVLCGGPYSVSSRPLILKKMESHFDLNDALPHTVPIWVRIIHLPLQFWSESLLSKIGARIGKLICTDRLTATRKLFSFARLLVEVDLEKDLVQEIKLKLPEGIDKKYDVEYEYIPKFCVACKSFGHNLENCKSRIAVVSGKQGANEGKSQPAVQKKYSSQVRAQANHVSNVQEAKKVQMQTNNGSNVQEKQKAKHTGKQIDNGESLAKDTIIEKQEKAGTSKPDKTNLCAGSQGDHSTPKERVCTQGCSVMENTFQETEHLTSVEDGFQEIPKKKNCKSRMAVVSGKQGANKGKSQPAVQKKDHSQVRAQANHVSNVQETKKVQMLTNNGSNVQEKQKAMHTGKQMDNGESLAKDIIIEKQDKAGTSKPDKMNLCAGSHRDHPTPKEIVDKIARLRRKHFRKLKTKHQLKMVSEKFQRRYNEKEETESA